MHAVTNAFQKRGAAACGSVRAGFLCHTSAADHTAPLENPNAQSGHAQIGGAGQAVVASTDCNGINHRWFSRSQNSEDGIRLFRPIRGRIALGLLRSQRLASTGGVYLFAQVVRYWPSYPHRQGGQGSEMLNRPLTVRWSPAAATPLSSHSVANPDPPPDRSKWSDPVLRIPVVRESKGTTTSPAASSIRCSRRRPLCWARRAQR